MADVSGPHAVKAPDSPLPVREAYRLWASGYDKEGALTHLENRLVTSLTPSLRGCSLLDAGCGNARRLPPEDMGLRRYTGVDLVPEMLFERSRGARGARGAAYVSADVRVLPFLDRVFDVIWVRLVVGHLTELERAYCALGRVADRGCRMIVSDFHPQAVAAGHVRTFRDPDGRLRSVEHHVHTPEAHHQAAARTGWSVVRVLGAPAGEDERPFYERAGRMDQFEAERDLPIVLVACLEREGTDP